MYTCFRSRKKFSVIGLPRRVTMTLTIVNGVGFLTSWPFVVGQTALSRKSWQVFARCRGSADSERDALDNVA